MDDDADEKRRDTKIHIAASIESFIRTQSLTEAEAAEIVKLTPEDVRDALDEPTGCPQIVLWHAWMELLKRVGEKPVND